MAVTIINEIVTIDDVIRRLRKDGIEIEEELIEKLRHGFPGIILPEDEEKVILQIQCYDDSYLF